MDLKQKTKPFRLAFNMFCCATIFCWAGVKPRETISGLAGRKAYDLAMWEPNEPKVRGGRFWRVLEWVIDVMHRGEHMHCYQTATSEWEARRTLGYE